MPRLPLASRHHLAEELAETHALIDRLSTATPLSSQHSEKIASELESARKWKCDLEEQLAEMEVAA